MNGKFLLDTNVVIGMFEKDVSITDRILPEMQLFLSSTVLGELLYGAYHSARVRNNLERARTFAARITVLPCDAETADAFGILKHQLRKKGRPIPDNDIWIAAVAYKRQLTLITRDRHFRQIESLDSYIW
jgi:tRNA(fMet)-specific endonuclease VapC